MRLSQNTLLIVANPFAAPLSAEGRCTALCPADPAEGGGRYVGASTRATVRKQPAGMRSPFGTRDKVSVMYALAPVKVADTSYYRAALKSGDALPAEDSDARIFGLYGQIAAIDARKQPEDKPATAAREKLAAEVAAMGITPAMANRVSLARASLAAFVADGGDRAQALAEWRKQGLAAVADAIDPPQPDKLADPPNPDATAIEGVVS